jgi:hypothetical protein
MAEVANAYDFYGASITVKEVSMSMWRMGINGNYPIIDSIALNSPAAKAGLSQGNIILSINDRVIKTVSELDAFTTNVLSVKILKGYARETIIIDRIAIEAEKTRRIAEENKTVATISPPAKTTATSERPDTTPPLKFDDTSLEKKYGKSGEGITGEDNLRREIDRLNNQIWEARSKYATHTDSSQIFRIDQEIEHLGILKDLYTSQLNSLIKMKKAVVNYGNALNDATNSSKSNKK